MTAADQLANLNDFRCVAMTEGLQARGSIAPLLSPAAVVLAVQLAFFAVRVIAGRFTNDLTVLSYLGLALAGSGLGVGIFLARNGNGRRGLSCAVASAAMMFFWYLNLELAHDYLFS
jgi:ABC-type Fe3+ transport system permease subunit